MEKVELSYQPYCAFCALEDRGAVKASYDGKTRLGGWAYMCEFHFRAYGVGLGTGRGQLVRVAERLERRQP